MEIAIIGNPHKLHWVIFEDDPQFVVHVYAKEEQALTRCVTEQVPMFILHDYVRTDLSPQQIKETLLELSETPYDYLIAEKNHRAIYVKPSIAAKRLEGQTWAQIVREYQGAVFQPYLVGTLQANSSFINDLQVFWLVIASVFILLVLLVLGYYFFVFSYIPARIIKSGLPPPGSISAYYRPQDQRIIPYG
ncbi:MAG: hypothetical protein ACYCQJ_13050 [Nitrososphaerales archaeon]